MRAQQLAPVYDAGGWYLGIGYLPGIPTSNSDLETSQGMRLAIGHRWGSRISTEAVVEWFEDFAYDNSSRAIWAFTTSLDGKVHLLTGRVQPFALGGLGFMRSFRHGQGRSDSMNDLLLRVGGGVDFFVYSDFLVGVHTTYVKPMNERTFLDFVSLGLTLQWY